MRLPALAGTAPASSPRWRGPLRLGAAVALLSAFLYAVTLPSFGLVSDEGNYLESSRRIWGWFDYLAGSLRVGQPLRAFSPEILDETWRWGGERVPHPPFSREVAGLSGWLFFGRTDPLVAYRLLGTVVAGLLAGAVATWSALRGGALAGAAAGLAFVAMPRVFAHAHFADTDFVLSALFFGALFTAAEAPRAPLLWSGILWGLAMATKFSAVLLPLVLLPWLAAFRPERLRELPLFAGAAIVAFVAVNPPAWGDLPGALNEYLRHALERRDSVTSQLPTFYFGRLYTFRPPWHYPLAMLALTTPLGLLLLAGLGFVAAALQPAFRRAGAMASAVVAVFLAALLLPSAPMHDDIRLFLPIFPFVALLAGLGAAWLAGAARLSSSGSRVPSALVAILLLCALAQPAIATVRLHPFQASYFNALVGGVGGAHARGLEVTGMKEVLNREAYRDLNSILPADAPLDGGPFLYEDLLFAQGAGWLRADVRVRAAPPAEWVLVVNRRGWFRTSDLALFTFGAPVYAVRLEGVPLLALYRVR
ncbi:MAG: glycosyltransferase family 39 protein [Gemmatimonadetes bacterium]|nr:glycosyltransferase family 39 protein [Gemmatimonadota bacterium]